MVVVSLPALATQWWSWWSAVNYIDTIDASYNIYNARLIQLNIPNSRNDGVNTSQARRWLADLPNRRPQNNLWNSQFVLSTVSWTTDLELYSITNSFNTPIDEIEAWRQVMWIAWNWHATITFDETTDKIDDVRHSWITTNIINGNVSAKKWYIASSWWNRFVVVNKWTTIETYAINANNNITSWTPADALAWTNRWCVAVKNQYLWMISIAYWATHVYTWQLYQINSSWVMSTVWAAQTIFTSANSSPWWVFSLQSSAMWSYTRNNTAYVYLDWSMHANSTISWTHSSRIYCTIDLATVSAFTWTLVSSTWSAVTWQYSWYGWWSWWSTVYRQIVAWWDNSTSRFYYVRWDNSIRYANWSWFTDATLSYFEDNTRWCRYWNTPTKLTTLSANINNSSTNSLLINNVAVNWTFTNLHINSLWMYEMTWSNEEDDAWAFKWFYIPSPNVTWQDDKIYLTMNWSAWVTENIENNINFTLKRTILLPRITVSDTKIKIKTLFDNNSWWEYKMWLWMTWWTFAAPTWTNNMTWSSSLWANVWADWSYVDISFT